MVLRDARVEQLAAAIGRKMLDTPGPVTRRRSSADASSRDANDMRVEVTTASALATSTRSCMSRSSRTHAARGHGGRGRRVLVPLTRSSARRTARGLESLGERTASSLSVPRESPTDVPPLAHRQARGHGRPGRRESDLRQVTPPGCRASCGQLGRKLPDSALALNHAIASSPESPQARFRDFPCLGARGSMDVNPQGWSGTKCHSSPRTERPSTPSHPREANSRKTPVWRSPPRLGFFRASD